MQKKEFLKKFWQYVKKAKSIAITSHTPPDPDSITSVIALYTILKNNAVKNVDMIYENIDLMNFSKLRNANKIKIVPNLAENFEKYDLKIIVDEDEPARISSYYDSNISLDDFICIDHHKEDRNDHLLKYTDPFQLSATQVIYQLFLSQDKIDKELAETILLGIIADSRNFMYVYPDHTEIFNTSKELLSVYGEKLEVLESKYLGIPEISFSIIQAYVANMKLLEIKDWPKFTYSFLDIDFIRKNKFTAPQLTSGYKIFCNLFSKSISGYGWGFIIKYNEEKSAFDVSFRAVEGSVDVHDLVKRVASSGGGHKGASGGNIEKSIVGSSRIEDCLKYVLDWLSNNKPVFS